MRKGGFRNAQWGSRRRLRRPLPARAGRCSFRGKLATNFIAHFMHFSGYGSSRFIARRRREKQANPDSNPHPCRKQKSVAEHPTILAANRFGRPRHSLRGGFVLFLGSIAQTSEGPGGAVSHTLGCAIRLIEQIKADAQQDFKDLVHRGSFHGSSFQSSISSHKRNCSIGILLEPSSQCCRATP